MKTAAARGIADIVSGGTETARDYIIPVGLQPRVMGAVASAVAEGGTRVRYGRGGSRDGIRLDQEIADPRRYFARCAEGVAAVLKNGAFEVDGGRSGLEPYGRQNEHNCATAPVTRRIGQSPAKASV